VIAAGALLAGNAISTAGADSPSTTKSCSQQLEVRVSDGYSGLGHEGLAVKLTNTGDNACTLEGWPTVDAVHRNGSSVALKRTRTTQFGPPASLKGIPVVTLGRGDSAYAIVYGADAPGGPSCGTNFWRLIFSAPRAKRRVTLSASLPKQGTYLHDCMVPEITMVVTRRELLHG
jgi:hypothetical protein